MRCTLPLVCTKMSKKTGVKRDSAGVPSPTQVMAPPPVTIGVPPSGGIVLKKKAPEWPREKLCRYARGDHDSDPLTLVGDLLHYCPYHGLKITFALLSVKLVCKLNMADPAFERKEMLQPRNVDPVDPWTDQAISALFKQTVFEALTSIASRQKFESAREYLAFVQSSIAAAADFSEEDGSEEG